MSLWGPTEVPDVPPLVVPLNPPIPQITIMMNSRHLSHFRVHVQWGPAIRFISMQTEPNLNNFVHGVCNYQGEMGNDLYYFVLGSTYGRIPKGTNQMDININLEGTILDNDVTILSSWVLKIDSASQTVLWTTQVYSTKHNEAFGCHVIPSDPSTMYVGGTVYNNGLMMYMRSGIENTIHKSTYKN